MLPIRTDEIWHLTDKDLVNVTLKVFRLQYHNNQLYRQFVDHLNRCPTRINSLEQIPFIPISFFKKHKIKTTHFEPEIIFQSSGTTGANTSRHFVKDIHLYQQSFVTAFELFYGPMQNYCILGLLPSYLERGNSSLIFMVKGLMELSGHKLNGFYLKDFEKLSETLSQLEERKQKTLLIGVTYALLDFAAQYSMSLRHTIIIETGGMKGRKEEMIRSEVHEQLRKDFGVQEIHSEYGMTELLSQAYSRTAGRFRTPPWMKVLIRDEDDPLMVSGEPENAVTGAINVID
ncbi:MAG: acyl transferase, partial [Chitinophagaceae bacterium]|nr:acyl transferase [Chitinophagaceae bacterium]